MLGSPGLSGRIHALFNSHPLFRGMSCINIILNKEAKDSTYYMIVFNRYKQAKFICALRREGGMQYLEEGVKGVWRMSAMLSFLIQGMGSVCE